MTSNDKTILAALSGLKRSVDDNTAALKRLDQRAKKSTPTETDFQRYQNQGSDELTTSTKLTDGPLPVKFLMGVAPIEGEADFVHRGQDRLDILIRVEGEGAEELKTLLYQQPIELLEIESGTP